MKFKIFAKFPPFLRFPDASSSNEAVHLQQRLKSLSSELVTLRNRLHTGAGQTAPAATATGGPTVATTVNNAVNNAVNSNNNSTATPNPNPQTLGGHGTTGAGLVAAAVGGGAINILSHLNGTNGGSCNTNGKVRKKKIQNQSLSRCGVQRGQMTVIRGEVRAVFDLFENCST